MNQVTYTNEFGNPAFTQDKPYDTFLTSSGLTVIDDTDSEHVIATTKNEFGTYEGDPFFRNNFKWLDQ